MKNYYTFTHTDDPDGIEVKTEIAFQWCPAEPDVGIDKPYIEIDYCGDMDASTAEELCWDHLEKLNSDHEH